MIEGLDSKQGTPEQRAGLYLLRILRRYRETCRTYGEQSAAARLDRLRLGAAERAYDAMPVADRQVRDSFDDALAVMGWQRLA